jgi:chemotaxis protein CheD
MKTPAHITEIILRPGEFHFGDRRTRIRTTLGSCVSIVMWHQKLLIGGMCHYLLPNRSMSHRTTPDGRYADEAIELFMREIRAAKTEISEYQVKIFGGGNMFPRHRRQGKYANVPSKNVIAARDIAKLYALNVIGVNLGGIGHRQIVFDVWSGDVWVRHVGIQNGDSSE